MVDFWWVLVGIFFGLVMGSSLALDGYFGREYNGDADE